MHRLPPLLLLLAIAACGSDSTSPEADPTPATGPATITIPGVADIAVLRSGPDGALLAQAASDAEGRATLDITAGDMLTIVDPSTGEPFSRNRLYTFVGVEPGDSLQTSYAQAAKNSAGGEAQFVTLQGEFPAHDSARITSLCNTTSTSSGFPYTFQVPTSCLDEPIDLLLETSVNQGGTYVRDQFAYLIDVPVDPSGTTVLDFTGLWRNDWQTVSFDVPLPAFATREIGMSLWPIREGTQFQNLPERVDWEGASNPPTELVTPLAPGYYDGMEIYLSHYNFDGQWAQFQGRVALDTTVTNVTPLMPSAAIGAFPEWDFDGPDRPRVSWTLNRGGIEGDAVVLSFSWSVGEDDYAWYILLPPGAESFVLPELPEELLDHMPPAPTEANSLSIDVEFQDSSFVDGYGERRRNHGFDADLIRYTDELGTQLYVGAYFDTGFGVNNVARDGARADASKALLPWSPNAIRE